MCEGFFSSFSWGRRLCWIGLWIVEGSRVEYLFSFSFNFVESGGHHAHV